MDVDATPALASEWWSGDMTGDQSGLFRADSALTSQGRMHTVRYLSNRTTSNFSQPRKPRYAPLLVAVWLPCYP